MKIIPATMIDAFAKGDILQVLLIAILVGAAVAVLGERGRPVFVAIEYARTSCSSMFFIVKLAPLGVLGAIAFTVGKYGVGSLAQLGFLVLIFYVSCALFVLVVGPGAAPGRLQHRQVPQYIREELLIVLGTASSDAVLPQLMRKLKGLGIGESTVGLVIPTGYSFNLDGFSIYLTLAAVFIAQATNTPLAFGDLLIILGVSMVTSKGRTACRARRSSSWRRPSPRCRRCRSPGWSWCWRSTGSWAWAGAHQHDRQRRRHGRDRRLGERHRPRGSPGARRRDQGRPRRGGRGRGRGRSRERRKVV